MKGQEYAKMDSTVPKRIAVIQSVIKHNDSVLEIGCNEGMITRFIDAAKITAIDLDENALERARSKDGRNNVKYYVGNAYDLKFKDSEFDIVIMGDIIEHLYDGNRALTEANRVLKPGGKLLISCPYHGWLKNIAIAMFNFEKHYDVEWQHIRFYTVRTLANLLEKNGFKVVKKHFIGRFPLLWKNMLFIAEKRT